MDAHDWDQRYRTSELVWNAEPNQWVRQCTQDLSPATALDLASGEGRNAVWLAERGWHVTAVDFSSVAMEKARGLASRRGQGAADRVQWVVDDVVSYEPFAHYGLVLVVYLHVPADQRKVVLRRAAAAMAPGATLLVVGHHTDNLEQGVGGPQDAGVLYSEVDVLADLAEFSDIVPRTARRVERQVPGQPRPALDVLVEAERSA